jgi:hypothetical protein
VARNEDGEFELMLGNKQLLSVFFLMVLLLCLCFVGGYLLGRSAAPVLTAANEPPPSASPGVTPPAPKIEKAEPPTAVPIPAPVEPEVKVPPAPTKTAPQVSTKVPEPVKQKEPAPKEVAKATPPATKQVTTAKQVSGSSAPVAGRIYLQLSATDKDKAEVMVDMLRRKNFAGMAAAVAERPGLFRVLVGPLAETSLSETKARLKADGFPGDQAIRRVF